MLRTGKHYDDDNNKNGNIICLYIMAIYLLNDADFFKGI